MIVRLCMLCAQSLHACERALMRVYLYYLNTYVLWRSLNEGPFNIFPKIDFVHRVINYAKHAIL